MAACQPTGVAARAPSARGDHRAGPSGDVGLDERLVAPGTVAVGEDRLGEVLDRRAGEAHDRCPEQGEAHPAREGEQGGPAGGGRHRSPQQPAPPQSA